MPRPKGSKNRNRLSAGKRCQCESISEAKAAVATQIEALTSEVNEAAAALKAKKAERKMRKNSLPKSKSKRPPLPSRPRKISARPMPKS